MSSYGVRSESYWKRKEHVVGFRLGERRDSAKGALDHLPEDAELKEVEMGDDGEIRLIFESEQTTSPADMFTAGKEQGS